MEDNKNICITRNSRIENNTMKENEYANSNTNLEIISQEIQDKISSTSVGINGNNNTTDILIANLIGLGVKEIYIFGEREEDSCRIIQNYKHIPEFFKHLDPKIKIFQDNYFENIAEFNINTSNTIKINEHQSSYMRLHTHTTEKGGILSKNIITEKELEKIPPNSSSINHQTSNNNNNRDINNKSNIDNNSINNSNSNNFESSSIIATLCADEFRKTITPLSEKDTPLSQIIYNTPNTNIDPQLHKKIIQIGAGGIGTYCAIGLANKKYNITVFDEDTYENRNKNRQIYCKVGESKANRLTNLINSNYNLNWTAQNLFLHEENLIELEKCKPEIIIGCVDNIETRQLLEKFAFEKGIPYIDGGVTTIKGQIYYGDKIWEQLTPNHNNPNMNPIKYLNSKNKVETKDITSNSCSKTKNPSIIIPNAIVGFQIANILPTIFQNLECANSNKKQKYFFNFESFSERRIYEKWY